MENAIEVKIVVDGLPCAVSVKIADNDGGTTVIRPMLPQNWIAARDFLLAQGRGYLTGSAEGDGELVSVLNCGMLVKHLQQNRIAVL